MEGSLQERIRSTEEIINKQQIQSNNDKKLINSLQRQIAELEDRLRFVLENDIVEQPGRSDNQLRNCLNDLLRENESLKRDLNLKNQEVERLMNKQSTLNQAVERLTKKILDLKASSQATQPSSKFGRPGQPSFSQNAKSSLLQTDDIDLLLNFAIPENVLYRLMSIRHDHQNILKDIIEYGTEQFTNRFLSNSRSKIEQKEILNLVVN